NDAFANLFGYAHDELLNQSMQKLFPSVEDFEKIGKEALTGLGLQTNMYYGDERFMRHKTGEIFWATTPGRTLTLDDPFKLAIWHFEKKTQV
ncbi:PAS domain-containing protein, partial [Mycobacterium tuberculosis]|nr:PAS domain-containing protein [Mycobacterium tuberculosis]